MTASTPTTSPTHETSTLDKRRNKAQAAKDGDGERAGPSEETAREESWHAEVQNALDEIGRSLDRETEKNRVWANRMVEIVDRERALAEEERKQRAMAKNLARRERKGALESAVGPGEHGI